MNAVPRWVNLMKNKDRKILCYCASKSGKNTKTFNFNEVLKTVMSIKCMYPIILFIFYTLII